MKELYSTTSFDNSIKDNVDRDNGVINGVLLARVGEVKGHGVYADSEFTKSIVDEGKKFKQGVKARFGHPNASSTTLGTYLGRYKNFRFEGDNAFADLHLDEVAKKSPKGNLYDYVLTMAETNPDQFGNSIVFRPKKTEVIRMTVNASEVNEDHDEIVDVKDNGDVEIDRFHTRLSSLLASDLVDEGAATDNLFSSDDEFAAIATTFLNDNPKVFELLSNNPEVLSGFMTKYDTYKERKQLNKNKNNFKMTDENKSWFASQFEELKDSFSIKKDDVAPKIEDEPKEKETISKEQFEEFNELVDSKFESMKEGNEKVVSDLNEENTKLKAELEKASNTATNVDGGNESPEANEKPVVVNAFLSKTAARIINKYKID